MSTVISVENLSKTYRLGQIGTGTFSRDLEVWWAKLRGKPNPMLRIGEKDHGNRDGEELWALRDISFTVQQGEVLGIIGRNGAGKSTLLKILSRVTAPTSGKIKVKGRIASLLEVGTGFHPELTGRENIYLNGAILGMSKQEVTRKFDEIVDFSEVEKFIDTPVKRYSSGMYVRLAFAVAAHLDPEILVVDEVLAVGDAEFQKKCLGKMGDVAKEGRTVLFVSHNMAAIKNLCTDSVYLKNGQMVLRATTENAINRYLSDVDHTLVAVSLRNRKDRQGSGRVKVINFYVSDLHGKKQAALKSGGDYLLVMEYEKNNTQNVFTNVVGSIGITDNNNQIILLFRSNFTNQNLNLANASGRIECKVMDLPLSQGSYKIIVFLSIGESETLDLVSDAAQITVESGGLFWHRQFWISHSLQSADAYGLENLMKNKFLALGKKIWRRSLSQTHSQVLIEIISKLSGVNLLILAYKQMGILNYGNSYVTGEEYVIRHVLKRYIKQPAPLFFDVGANVGDITTLLRKFFPTAEIWVFEPNKFTYNELLKVLIGRDVKCFNIGLGSAAKTEMLYVPVANHISEHASANKEIFKDFHKTTEIEGISFEMQTIDAFCLEHNIPSIDFIKIDTEGFELAVLEGARRMLSAGGIKIIQFEFGECHVFSRTFMLDFYRLLSGFQFFRLGPSALIPLGDYSVANEIFRFQNIVAIHGDVIVGGVA